MKRLGILHTAPFLVGVFKQRLSARYPELDSFHVVDEGLIQTTQRAGRLTTDIVRRIATHVGMIQETGAEAILFTCATTSPAVDLVRPLANVPIMKIDDPMMAQAVRSASTIGLLCTSQTAMPCSKGLLKAHAAEQGKDIAIVEALASEAYGAAGGRGTRKTHDRLVRESAVALAAKCELVILGQASMAHLAAPLREDDRQARAGLPRSMRRGPGGLFVGGRPMSAARYRADDLNAFTAAVFRAAGLPDADAALIADGLIEADLRGLHSHGVARIPIYLKRLSEGIVNPTPAIDIREVTPVAALVDGDDGMGFVVGDRAMKKALAMAETLRSRPRRRTPQHPFRHGGDLCPPSHRSRVRLAGVHQFLSGAARVGRAANVPRRRAVRGRRARGVDRRLSARHGDDRHRAGQDPSRRAARPTRSPRASRSTPRAARRPTRPRRSKGCACPSAAPRAPRCRC